MTTRSRDTWVAVALENTPGTAADGADLRLLDADFTSPGLEITKPLRADATSRHAMPGVPALASHAATLELIVPVDVSSEVRGAAGDPISPPPYDALLQACNLVRADDPGANTATYAVGGDATATIEWRAGLRRFRMVGCRGTVTLTADAGGDLVWTFSMMGRAQVIHTGTSDARPTEATRAYRRCRTFDAEIELAQVNNDGTSGAAIPLMEALIGVSFDLGNQMTRPGDVTASDGAALPVVVAVQPTQQVNMVMPDVAAAVADPFWALVAGDGLLSVRSRFNSPDADTSVGLVLGSASATSGENPDADGVVTQQITASGVDVATDPLQIVFTTPAP